MSYRVVGDDLSSQLLARQGRLNGDEVLFCCPFHSDNNPSCSYSISKDLFNCFSCGEAGSGDKLSRRLADEVGTEYPNKPRPITNHPTSKGWPVATEQYATLCSQTLFGSRGKPGLDYLQRRGFSYTSMQQFGLGFDTNYNMVTLPYHYSGQVCHVKTRFVDKSTHDGEKYGAASKGSLVPYQIDRALSLDSTSLVITEGEFDCITSYQILPLQPAIAVPGKDIFKAEWLALLEKYDKIFICLDNEVKAHESVQALADLLGTYRCYRVEIPKDCKDLNDWLVSKRMTPEAYQASLDQARPIGKPLVCPINDYLDKAKSAYSRSLESGLSTGYELIDRVFGGFRPGELTVLSAYPGTGKTTLALEIARNIAKNNKVMLGLFENSSESETVPNLAGLCRGKPYHGMSEAEFSLFVEGIEEFKNIRLLDRFSTTSENELSHAYRLATREGVKFLVLDHLHFMTEADYDVANVVKMMGHITKLARHEHPTIATMLIVQPSKADQWCKEKCPHTGKDMAVLNLHRLKGGTKVIENANNVLLLQKDGIGVYMEAAKIRSNATRAKAGEVKTRIDFDKDNFRYRVYEYTQPKPKDTSGFDF